jgi:hypothetical protein
VITIEKSCVIGATRTTIRYCETGSAHVVVEVGPNREGNGRHDEVYIPIELLEEFIAAWNAVDPALKDDGA